MDASTPPLPLALPCKERRNCGSVPKSIHETLNGRAPKGLRAVSRRKGDGRPGRRDGVPQRAWTGPRTRTKITMTAVGVAADHETATKTKTSFRDVWLITAGHSLTHWY